MSSNELVKSVSIENILNKRDALQAIVEQMNELSIKAKTIADSMDLRFFDIKYRVKGTRYDGDDFAEVGAAGRIAKSVDAELWRYLGDESGLVTLMDTKTKSEWHDSLEKGDFPALNSDNIRATFEALSQSKVAFMEKGVIQVFKELSWNYKTNSPVKFGSRIIVDRFICRWGNLNYGIYNKVDDLIKVFHMVDKKPVKDHRDGISEEFARARKEGMSEFENEYIKLRWYAKGSAHVTFKRPDLVQELNRIVAKHYGAALARA